MKHCGAILQGFASGSRDTDAHAVQTFDSTKLCKEYGTVRGTCWSLEHCMKTMFLSSQPDALDFCEWLAWFLLHSHV